MPVVGKRVDLSEALEDSPQTQGLVEDMESSVNPLREFTSRLKDSFQSLYTNQVKVSESLKSVGELLDSVNDKSFGDKDPFMTVAMNQLGKYVSELQGWQEMLCTQLNTALVQQLDAFINNDMTKLTSLRDAFSVARTEHNQAMAKYSRVSKKKETERSRFDANSELFSSRRRFHQSSLQYYAELNSFSFKKKFAVLDPLLAFMHSQLAYFKMGHEILTDEVGKFLTSLNVEIQKVRSEHEQTMKQQKKAEVQLEQISPQICIPDPDPSDPFVEYQPANLHLTKNSGYLFLKTGNKSWERIYFFTKDHLLYSQVPQKAAVVLLDLTAAGVDASSADIDDKRYAFFIMTVNHFSDEQGQQLLQKKPYYFQAESAKSRDEWVATVINIVSKKKQQNTIERIQPQTRERSDSEIVRMERERVRSFVKSVSGSSLTSPKKQPSNPPTPQKKLQPSTQPAAMQQQQRSRPPPPPPSARQGPSTVQQLLEIAETTKLQEMGGDGYLKSYVVQYLGTLEVQQKTGVGVVKDTIRRIIAARALKNLMSVYTVNMVVTHRNVSLQDQISKKITTQFKLKDISYCAKHPDNEKLFGVIARVYQNGVEKHVCYAFEAMGMQSGKVICQSIIEAIKVAVKMITGAQNISQTPDEPVPSFDLPRTLSPSSVFNVPTQQQTSPTGVTGMSKSLSTGSFTGTINLPEDGNKGKPTLNESFSEDEEKLVDMATAPPSSIPMGLDTDPVYSVPKPSGERGQTLTTPPSVVEEQNLLDLTTPTVPSASTVATTPTTGDLMGLDDLQTVTNQALLSNVSPTDAAKGGDDNPQEPTAVPQQVLVTPADHHYNTLDHFANIGTSAQQSQQATPDPFSSEPHYETLPGFETPPDPVLQTSEAPPPVPPTYSPNPFDS